MTIFYTVIYPIISQWPEDYNVTYIVSHYMLWISNIVLYGLPTLVGGFTWLWNAYLIGGYVAWTQYLIVWGGSIMQLINFVVMLSGAMTYTNGTNINSFDTAYTAFAEWGVFTVVTAGCYIGYWMLNDYFLEYYVIEEINHKIDPTKTETTVDEQADATI